jgi:2-polyprenyl-6-methoxyphenol hydroxylase-like FAD-dependent oxidoreductase
MSVDICIRGTGAVGKALALLLARERIRVGLVDTHPSASPTRSMQTAAEPATDARADTPGADIRAYALNAASRELLQELRVWPDSATPVEHMQVFGDSGEQNEPSPAQVRFDGRADAPLTWIVPASELNARLEAALSFAPSVQRLSRPESAQLTVICEGKASRSRAAQAQWQQFGYAQTALAAVLKTSQPHASTAWQWMGGRGAPDDATVSATGEVCALLPMGSPEPGNLVALVWSVSDEHADQLMSLDATAFEAAVHHATHGRLGDFTLTSHRARWPLLVGSAERWIGTGLDDDASGQPTRWVLAGDAAHALHPLAGQGLNLGLGDAKELAAVLAGKPSFRSFGDERLLRAYERARKGDAAALRLATDGLQRLFASGDERIKSLRTWGMKGFDALAPLKSFVMKRASGR